MLKKDVKIGMKVVPFQKTIGRKFEECDLLTKAKKIKQPYLYVIGYGAGRYSESCKLQINMKDTCGYFNPCDFDKYIESETKITLVHLEDEYTDIGRKTPLTDIKGKPLCVGDVVTLVGGYTSIVCTKRGNIMGLWGTNQEVIKNYTVVKIKSFKDLKDGDVYGNVKVIVEDVVVKEEKKVEEVKGKLVYHSLGSTLNGTVYGIIGAKTSKRDVEREILNVGDVVTYVAGNTLVESIVCTEDGNIMGMFRNSQYDFYYRRKVRKVRSYTSLKDGELFNDAVEVLLDKIDKIEEPKGFELKLSSSYKTMDKIGSETFVKDIEGKLLFVGDVVQFEDGYTSIVCTKECNIMGIWNGDIKPLIVRYQVRKVKSYTELKAGEKYCDTVDVIVEVPNLEVDKLLSLGKDASKEAVRLLPSANSSIEMIKHTISGTTTTVTLPSGRKGIARLYPTDKFDKVEGFRIAYARACGEDAFKDFIKDKPLEAFTDKELLEEIKRRFTK